jgi:CRP/FNR family transcriptional regulator, cyclic AMP receptor protein
VSPVIFFADIFSGWSSIKPIYDNNVNVSAGSINAEIPNKIDHYLFYTTGKLMNMEINLTNISKDFIKSYQKKEVIFQEGSVGYEMYVIVSGKIRITARSNSKKDKLIRVLEPGNFFGEMALVDSSPRSAAAISDEENTKLVEIDQEKFMYLVSQQPAFALVIMEALCRRIRSLTNQIV